MKEVLGDFFIFIIRKIGFIKYVLFENFVRVSELPVFKQVHFKVTKLSLSVENQNSFDLLQIMTV